MQCTRKQQKQSNFKCVSVYVSRESRWGNIIPNFINYNNNIISSITLFGPKATGSTTDFVVKYIVHGTHLLSVHTLLHSTYVFNIV